MNHSSLFSFEESSLWDPKVIRKCLVVPPDQLAKLSSIPGWAKVQDNENTLRLDKDFTIGSSQSECSVDVTQRNEKIEKNLQLFKQQIEDCETVSEVYEANGKKLTRSSSLSSLNKISEKLLNNKTLKQTLSLQNLCHLTCSSDLNSNFKYFMYEKSHEKQSPSDICAIDSVLCRPFENILSNQYKTPSELQKSEEIFLSKEENFKAMDTASELPGSILISVENTNLSFVVSKDSNGVLSAKSDDARLSNQFVKCVAENGEVVTYAEIKDNGGMFNAGEPSDTNLSFVVSKDSNGVLSAKSDAAGLSNQFVKCVAENGEVVTYAEIKENGVMFNAGEPSENGAMVSSEFIKHVLIESANVDNSRLHLENVNDNIGMLHVDNNLLSESGKESIYEMSEVSASPSNIISDDFEEVANDSVNVDPALQVFLNKSAEDHGISDVICNSDMCVKVEDNVVTDVGSALEEKSVSSDFCYEDEINKSVLDAMPLQDPESSIPITDVCIVSDMEKDYKIVAMVKNNDDSISQKEIAVADANFVMQVNDVKSDQKVFEDKTCDMSNKGESSSKKRKSESRNKRSKRLKSEEKQSSLKIRSIKKVGEMCYSVEEVKTMLDIMKQLL